MDCGGKGLCCKIICREDLQQILLQDDLQGELATDFVVGLLGCGICNGKFKENSESTGYLLVLSLRGVPIATGATWHPSTANGLSNLC
jgi:hypothetical protein